jgi:hypothetical protein
MFPETPESLAATAQPIACGNTWDQLPVQTGNTDRHRPCAACHRTVYNLAALSRSEWETVQASNPHPNLCVVYEPPRFSAQGLPLKIAMALLMLHLLSQQALAQTWQTPPSDKPAASTPRFCEEYLMTPKVIVPQEEPPCLDENNQHTDPATWLQRHRNHPPNTLRIPVPMRLDPPSNQPRR